MFLSEKEQKSPFGTVWKIIAGKNKIPYVNGLCHIISVLDTDLRHTWISEGISCANATHYPVVWTTHV